MRLILIYGGVVYQALKKKLKKRDEKKRNIEEAILKKGKKNIIKVHEKNKGERPRPEEVRGECSEESCMW